MSTPTNLPTTAISTNPFAMLASSANKEDYDNDTNKEDSDNNGTTVVMSNTTTKRSRPVALATNMPPPIIIAATGTKHRTWQHFVHANSLIHMKMLRLFSTLHSS